MPVGSLVVCVDAPSCKDDDSAPGLSSNHLKDGEGASHLTDKQMLIKKMKLHEKILLIISEVRGTDFDSTLDAFSLSP